MLVLSRSVDESIVFPELGVTIQVASIRGRAARLAIQAPRSIRVLRKELLERIPHHSNSTDTADLAGNESRQASSHHPDDSSHAERMDIEQVQDQVGVARLALFLCQNQLKFDNHVFAQETLDHAIAAMEKLESMLAQHPGWKSCTDDPSIDSEFSFDEPGLDSPLGTETQVETPTELVDSETLAKPDPVVNSAVVKESAIAYQISGSSFFSDDRERQTEPNNQPPSTLATAGWAS